MAGGEGIFEVVRAAGRALDASLAVVDANGAVLAVAARSPAEEQALVAAEKTDVRELRVGGDFFGELRFRWHSGPPAEALLTVVCALVAAEAERVRGPERASAQAVSEFLDELLARRLDDRDELLAGAAGLGLRLERRRQRDRRARPPARAQRRGLAPAACSPPPSVPRAPAERARWRRCPSATARATARSSCSWPRRTTSPGSAPRSACCASSRPTCTASPSRSAAAGWPTTRWSSTAPARRRCSPRMLRSRMRSRPRWPSRRPGPTGCSSPRSPDELERFYADTVEPLVAYDEQYEIGLVNTLETFLDCDANVAQSAQRLFTHRHTIRYRLERVRELTGHDVGSTHGREQLSLGLKAMRVLGIPPRVGPATEPGTEAGRVPSPPQDRPRG